MYKQTENLRFQVRQKCVHLAALWEKKIKKNNAPPTHCLGKGSGKNISTLECVFV
jgi:hypothetical protein